MRKALYAALMLVLVAALVLPASAQNGQNGLPSVVSFRQATGTATITAVDQSKRTVTLRTPDGDTQTYTVSQDVRNLGQVKPGDRLTATVSEKLAIHVERGGSRPTAYEVLTIESAPAGAKPGFIATDTVTAIGVVDSIDYDDREVTITGPRQTLTYQVGPGVQNLSQVKKGDNVVVQYTETIIMYVE